MMSQSAAFLAFDLGAESGRAIIGQFDGKKLRLAEVHRFSNGPVILLDGLHWDVLHLWAELKEGLAAGLRECAKNLASVGLDTWGVDFGLLDKQGSLIANPYHYRDSRTDGMLAEAFGRVSRQRIFEETGIQFMPINSLYQLLAMVINRSPAMDIAETFLTMPDLFNYWLTGRKVCEFSIATTTQCYNPRQRDWAWPVLEQLNIPAHIFPEVVPAGTNLGPLWPSIAEEMDLGSRAVPVIAPACHDTGSAVAAAPAVGQNFAWISSGTWSVLGAELPEPVINERSLAFNLTNEGGLAGTFRLSKNVMGLWLVQECRRTWERQGEFFSYEELTQMAAQAPLFQAIIDPDYGEFLKPGDMPARIQAYSHLTNQPALSDKATLMRSILEGIALKYRWVLERLEEVIGQRLEPIYIVGGGTQNRLLNQFTANATGRQVITGPIEATVIGNILAQAIALGYVASMVEGREVVRNSFEVNTYEPNDQAAWAEAYGRLLAVMELPATNKA